MNRPLLHLPRWQWHLLIWVTGLLLLTGGLWLGFHYLWGAGAGELPHAWEAPLIRLHGAAAFAGLFTLGVFSGSHVPAGWRVTRHGRPHPRHAELSSTPSGLWGHRQRHQRRAHQRWTGLALLGLALGLVLSGYMLYYFAPEDWRPTLGWLHAGLGVTLALSGAWHSRRRRTH
jgi:hypothetical protein